MKQCACAGDENAMAHSVCQLSPLWRVCVLTLNRKEPVYAAEKGATIPVMHKLLMVNKIAQTYLFAGASVGYSISLVLNMHLLVTNIN